ncbi:MAG TPA: hypothetical protein V6C58_07335 [Allocoleopsis sp.]
MKHYKIIFDGNYYLQFGNPTRNNNQTIKSIKTIFFSSKDDLMFSYKISNGFKKTSTVLNPSKYIFSLVLALVVQRDWDNLNPLYSSGGLIPESVGYRASVSIYFDQILFPPTVTNSDYYYQYTQPIYFDQFYQKGFDISAGDPADIPKLTAAYAAPYKYLSPNLPITAEFLFDYEDTLLPLKEECPVGTSKLLTNNYPGYICVDYQPIENSIKDIRNLIKKL